MSAIGDLHTVRARTHHLLNDFETRLGRRVAIFTQVLIGISLISFALETLPTLAEPTRRILGVVEFVTVMLFTLEYGLRLWSSESRLRFVFSFFGLIDLLAILPFYLTTGFDLRGLRSLRMLRIFRILKIARYNRAMKRFARAFTLAREELILFVCATVLVLFASAVGVYYFENEAQPEDFASVFHALWWALETLTTIGYGDVMPITLGGRIFTFIMAICGLGVVAMPASIMAAALGRADHEMDNR